MTTAQRRLRRSVFEADYLRAPVDGIFGEATARACKRAKWWLGYPETRIAGVYGDELDGYLNDKVKLPSAFAKRRAARLKAAQEKPLGQKAYEEALKYLGVKESPAGSNRILFSDWYGMVGPWCAMFVSYCFHQVGGQFHYAYVPYIANDARAGNNGLQLVSEPVRGDVVCYDWQPDKLADHTGFFEGWTNKAASEFTAIEGNTSVGNDSNGGQVMRRERRKSQVQAFVRVGR